MEAVMNSNQLILLPHYSENLSALQGGGGGGGGVTVLLIYNDEAAAPQSSGSGAELDMTRLGLKPSDDIT
ncbi:hypothetical protein FQA47_000157 [Oryzias melastigma]|uniref:Uncharacterized protein n=1 Tax=Oryzias melastigma TaxID=30732 RepID=A0A834BK84_ORYME|nr:hypothetical protein FQA47_000157 [Oryzias melastigma]